MGIEVRSIVGWLPGDSGRDALALATRFARSGPGLVQACTVLPQSWPFQSMTRVDTEYQQWLAEHGADAARTAADELTRLGAATGDPASFWVTDTAESAGLVAAAEQHDANVVVLGSARRAKGRFDAGSTTDSLLHSSAIPLALAPAGTRESTEPFRRISCAYVGTSQSQDALGTAVSLAEAWSVPLRLVAFAPRASTTFPPLGGYGAEDVVSARWKEQAEEILSDAEAAVMQRHPNLSVSAAVGVGHGWEAAVGSLNFGEDNLLVVGSSRLGPVARVFLGSSASKIIRCSPAPMLVVPRGATSLEKK